MQETKTNALGIRITDAELRRLEAIKDELGLPSMTNTSLGHDLLIMGLKQMERRGKEGDGETKARVVHPAGYREPSLTRRSAK